MTLANGKPDLAENLLVATTHSALGTGNKVVAEVDTMYPFSDTLSTTITADQAFMYYVRIPSWVTGGTISVNGGRVRALNPLNGLQAVSARAGTTRFVLNLPAKITTGSIRRFGRVSI